MACVPVAFMLVKFYGFCCCNWVLSILFYNNKYLRYINVNIKDGVSRVRLQGDRGNLPSLKFMYCALENVQ